ncbi:MAG: acyltransferase [Pseudomonadota bacterium]
MSALPAMYRRQGRLTRLGHFLANLALWGFRMLIRPLGPTRAIRMGGWVGARLIAGLPVTRRRIESNLARIRPELDAAVRAAIARAVGDNFGRVILEYEWMPAIARDQARYHPSGPGWSVFTAARAEGRGAILAAAHFGNWEAVRCAAAKTGPAVAFIRRSFNNRYFDAAATARVAEAGEPLLPRGATGARALIRHVRAGGAVLILVDQKQTGAPKLDFLGHPAETVLAAAELALKLEVPLIPVAGRRRADGVSFDALFATPIAPTDPTTMMQQVNNQLGAWIEADPGQWFWLHRRWR